MSNENLGLWGFFQYGLSMSSVLISRNGKKKKNMSTFNPCTEKTPINFIQLKKNVEVTFTYILQKFMICPLTRVYLSYFHGIQLSCWLKELAYVNNPCWPSWITFWHNSHWYWWMRLKSSISLMYCDILLRLQGYSVTIDESKRGW